MHKISEQNIDKYMNESDLQELKAFFKAVKLPEKITLDEASVIFNIQLFLATQYNYLDLSNSPTVRRPAADRLVKLKQILSNHKYT